MTSERRVAVPPRPNRRAPYDADGLRSTICLGGGEHGRSQWASAVRASVGQSLRPGGIGSGTAKGCPFGETY